MENKESSTLPLSGSSQPEQTSTAHVKQLQPVPSSSGHDLARDLVWQRDPDCSKDPAVGQGQQIKQVHVKFPDSTGTPVLPAVSVPYSYRGPSTATMSTSSGDNVSTGIIPTFQQPNVYTGLRPENIVTYIPSTNPQAVVVDTDGNRIQQNPVIQQNIPFAGYQVQSNMIPVQFSTNNQQYVSMQAPGTIAQQQQQVTFSYPRLVPFNPQTMAMPRMQVSNHPQIAPKLSNLNVAVANQVVQTPGSLNIMAATQVSSPVMTSPITQSPTTVASPGTESVKSPTYVYMCNKCNYVTPYRSSFKTHYSSHIQYKPFQCAYCDHSTIMKQPMQKHVKLKHAIEDSEGFTYESDSKKENIIDFFCNQCRSTMNMEEAKSYLAKFEGSQEKLKPGPTKRKLSKDFQNEDDEYTPKRKKTFSWSENYNEEEDNPDQNTGARTKKSPVSSCLKTKGRPRKILNSDGKTFGKPKKFPGFGKKYLPQTFNVKTLLCHFCEFKSASHRGLKKHCEWRHPEKRIKCKKCSYFTYFEEEFQTHLKNNQCDSDINLLSAKRERSKSPEKSAARSKKPVSNTEENKGMTISDTLSGETSDDSSIDEIQLNCPHCNFVSDPFALKRHLFFYHKECDWRCKHCGFISSSKKEVVRHSNKIHTDSQPSVVQTFADISSLMPEDVAEQEKATPPDKDISENEKVVSKHRLIDRDFIKTNRKRLVLGKKCVSTLVNGQSGTEDKLQIGDEKKSLNIKRGGRKREEKEVHDQSSFVVRPKKLKIATIGFSCVYCTYAAPLRHQLRLHCYEKHTKHPACLMEFINSQTSILEERVMFARDMTEDKKALDEDIDDAKVDTKSCEQLKGEDNTELKSINQSEKVSDVHLDKKSTGQSEMKLVAAEDANNQSNESSRMEIDEGDNTNIMTSTKLSYNSEKDDQTNIELKKDSCDSDNLTEKTGGINECMTSKNDEDQNKDVLSCMENILSNVIKTENGGDTNSPVLDNNGAIESKTINYILPNKMNGHKFLNPFSTLIIQLNSTQIKVKDAFDCSLDDVDIYLEKFGVRTLNMDSLTPKQFGVFMRKFGNKLQPLTL